MNDPIASIPVVAATQDIAQAQPSSLEIRGKTNEVPWDNTAAVTTRGALVYIAQFLDTTGAFDWFVAGAPMEYASNNSHKPRDVLGTLLLSVLSGLRRYTQVNELRQEKVLTGFLGMCKAVSEDSARKAFARGSKQRWLDFLEAENFKAYEPLLQEAYVLELDMTVVPLYGHQEGAQVSYNPAKPQHPYRLHRYLAVGRGHRGAARQTTCPQIQPAQALAVVAGFAAAIAPGICPGRHRQWQRRLHVRPGTRRGRLPVQGEDHQRGTGVVQEIGIHGRPLAKGRTGLGRGAKYPATGWLECDQAVRPVATANAHAKGHEGFAR